MNECTFDMQIPCVSGWPLYVRYPDPQCILHWALQAEQAMTSLQGMAGFQLNVWKSFGCSSL